ncbi:MAG: efflux RND transporter periplasmic adaptor subunit [Candidatus Omnitrophota bacterium]
MSAFKFRFRKKPLNFSKIKKDLAPDKKEKQDEKNPEEPVPKEAKKITNAEAVQGKFVNEKDTKKDGGSSKESATKRLDQALGLKQAGKRPASGRKDLFKRRRRPKAGTLILITLIFLGILIFGIGQKYKPELISSLINAAKEKLGLKAPSPEEPAVTEEEAVAELVTVRTYRVARGDFVDMLSGMGTAKGDREIELRFSVNGVVDSINFFEGDMVRKGDIIATLDQKDALLKLEYSKSKLKTQEVAQMSAKKKLEIHQKLYDEGIIIEPKLEEMKLEHESAGTQVKSAQKEVEFALSELDKTYLYSPIDGVMGTRDVEVGEFVNSNIKVATLFDTESIVVEMGVIEKDISRVALGQKAKVNVDTYQGVDFEGKIDSVAPIIKGKSRTLTVKIKIKNDNPKGTLLPGMFARTWVSVYEKKNTIKVPAACLYDLDEDGEFDSVYVVDEENIAKARPVKIGYISTDYVEIVDGLREAEQIVSETMAEVKDGVKVDVIEIQEAMF